MVKGRRKAERARRNSKDGNVEEKIRWNERKRGE